MVSSSSFDGYYWEREEFYTHSNIYLVWYQTFGYQTYRELIKSVPKYYPNKLLNSFFEGWDSD